MSEEERNLPDMAINQPLSLTAIVAITRTNGLGVNGTLPWRLSKEMAHFRKATSNIPSTNNGEGEKMMNAVIMGRKTWQSIPPKFRPLKGRVNVVISHQDGEEAKKSLGISAEQHSHLVTSLDGAAELLRSHSNPSINRTFLIGGAQLYAEALEKQSSAKWKLDKLMITRIHSPEFSECDVFLPEFRTVEQIGKDDQGAGVADSSQSTTNPIPEQQWKLATDEEFDADMGENVQHNIQEENGVHYTFQLWNRLP